MRLQALIVAAVLAPMPALSQQSALAPGARVRVEAPELFAGRATGTVMAVSGDSVRVALPTPGVRPDRPEAVRYFWMNPATTSIAVSEGRSRRGAIRRGALAGLTAGVVTSVAAVIIEATDVDSSTEEPGMMILILPLYTASTTVIGGMLGGLFSVERWRPAR